MMRKPSSVAQYLCWQSDEARAALDRLRATIRAAAPGATEGIRYAMPAFELHDRGLCCYAAFKDHYSLFPMSSRVISEHVDALGARATGKGTIQFRYDERLPVSLVKKIVKARRAEIEARPRR